MKNVKKNINSESEIKGKSLWKDAWARLKRDKIAVISLAIVLFYSLIALFGTALGPVVTYVMFDLNLSLIISIPSAILSGLV